MSRPKKTAKPPSLSTTREQDPELLCVQELFHGLIRSRAREGTVPIPKRLPRLNRELLEEREPRWFAVPGMYGGFSFRLKETGRKLELIAESWCRVVDGSERRHSVTSNQVILLDEGFA